MFDGFSYGLFAVVFGFPSECIEGVRSLRVFGFFVGLAVDCGCEGYRGGVSGFLWSSGRFYCLFYGLFGVVFGFPS